MFIILLRFAENRGQAGALMSSHNAWIQQGFDDGIFFLVGSLPPASGGAIMASGVSADELRRRVELDPFVVDGVVTAEIIEIAPNRLDERLQFLRG
jgi:uncharacterized protein YciI